MFCKFQTEIYLKHFQLRKLRKFVVKLTTNYPQYLSRLLLYSIESKLNTHLSAELNKVKVEKLLQLNIFLLIKG